MKTFLTIIFAAAIITLAFGQTDTSKYVLTIKQGRYEKTGTQTYLVVPTTLTNNTNDTLKYLSMSCSWQEFYYLDNDNLSIKPWACDRNGPIILTLVPFKSVDTELKLVIGQSTNFSKLRFKIGFNLLQIKNNMLEVHDEYVKNNTENIIWSNSVTLIDPTVKRY